MGIPLHWGLRCGAERLSRPIPDAKRRRFQLANAGYKAFLVNIESVRERVNGDGNKTLLNAPRPADNARAAHGIIRPKSPSLSMSLAWAAKACQVACSEWNDIRDEVGHCVGVYDNPAV